jgi:voltage-gated potassium channel
MMNATIAIFGAGMLGLDVAAQLSKRDCDLIVLDDDEAVLETARAKGYAAQSVDYRDDEELKGIGIGQHIGLLFALFHEESKNVFLTISARALDPKLEIVSLIQSRESHLMLQAAGADKVIDLYEISGRKIHDLIRSPLIAETLEHIVFGQQDLNLAEIEVAEGSSLAGMTLDSLSLSHDYNLVLLGVVDREKGSGFVFALGKSSYQLDPGDVLVVIGPQHAVARFRRDAQQNQ